ncbi:hypothetical protein HanHA300_Chr05g0167851 [Helianthus annuus]|nr:hypothetical protein HanHA300_Chr05g0167851 [Helianthus annuus]KAJ0583890.1 hypothetical protein HanHA89_Chr05g0181901 [Helianthus annuus]KAJ0746521.1 hypothetical protein HanOQP8_Chr05g0178731 [Helianthus annuus]KAJ0749592.1 hypothetical protein HanLR1_Chr05g0171751 [Helianthus annuus]
MIDDNVVVAAVIVVPINMSMTMEIIEQTQNLQIRSVSWLGNSVGMYVYDTCNCDCSHGGF